MEDRIFKYALIISLVIHIFILARLSYSNIHFKSHPLNKIEVIYPKLSVQSKTDPAIPRPRKGMKVDLKKESQELTRSESNLSSFMKDMSKLADDFLHSGKKPKTVDPEKIKRKISIPEIDTKQIKNPVYLNYYQTVRSRIREKAYENYEQFDTGEVYLTFVLEANGLLKAIKIIEEKSNANQYLRRVSLKSVEQANPFPPFPSDLKYPELSFNIVISFEIE